MAQQASGPALAAKRRPFAAVAQFAAPWPCLLGRHGLPAGWCWAQEGRRAVWSIPASTGAGVMSWSLDRHGMSARHAQSLFVLVRVLGLALVQPRRRLGDDTRLAQQPRHSVGRLRTHRQPVPK